MLFFKAKCCFLQRLIQDRKIAWSIEEDRDIPLKKI